MARLIDADALETRMGSMCDEFDTDHLFIDAIVYEIGNTPTVDAVPAVHGWWIPTYHTYYNRAGEYQIADEWHCSNCGIYSNDEWHYCPNCGAHMDQEVTGDAYRTEQ